MSDTKEVMPILADMAKQHGMDVGNFWSTMQSTVLPNATQEQALAFLTVCREYKLNPLIKEVYAFPSRGGIQPIVGVDGWLAIANRQPQFDGLETEEINDAEGNLIAIKATIWRSDRKHPTTATERMSECVRPTPIWTKYPCRMLTNKAIIQAIRRAFSISGICDPDEGERIAECQSVETVDIAEATKLKMDAIKSRITYDDSDCIDVEDVMEDELGKASESGDSSHS
jgi:phage recombination protein Bet